MPLQRIAVISYHTCPLSDEKDAEIGGMNTYILELSKALAKKGFYIDIYTRSVDKRSPLIKKISINLRVIHLPAGDFGQIPKKELPQYIPEFTKNLYSFFKKEKLSYDLISAHYYLSGLIGLSIKKKYGWPLTLTFHTLGLMKNLVARNEDGKEDLQRVKSELLLIKDADQIIATSESDREYIHTLYDCPFGKITVLTPGVDLKFFRPIDKTSAKKFIKADPNHKLILFVGRIEALKGIDVILYAIKILLQKMPNLPLCLWVVGGDSIHSKKEFKHLKELRRLLGLTTYVRFVGKKIRAELPYYYNAADIVLLPSQYESFGITALEAMTCGTPVITTDATGISALLNKEHSSLLTSASNPIGLARKIENLLTNGEEYQRISKGVLKKVQDLGWENVAEKFIQVANKY